MTHLVYAAAFNDDLLRVIEHLLAHEASQVDERLASIVGALELLLRHPLIGRRAGTGSRELVIGRGSHGYVARYQFDAAADIVYVLALRAQREAGFTDD